MATIEYDIKINDQGAIKSLGQLEDELSQINEELRDVPLGSQAFKDLTKQSQILNKELEKVNNEVEGLKFDDKLMAADGAAKIFAGSLSAAVGTLGVLGVESEVFGEFEEKAASAIAVGLGIKDVSEGFMQFTTVMKKSGIAAKLFGNVTKTALIATGIGAFVVVLGTIIAYWDEIVAGVKKAANAFPFVGKAIDAVKDTFNSLFEAARPVLEFLGILPDEAERIAMAVVAANEVILSEGERELALAQARKASAQEIFDIRQRLATAEIERLKADNAEKDEIFKAETTLLALQIAEQTRLKEEAAANDLLRRQKEIEGFEAIGEQIRGKLEVVGMQSLGVAKASDQLADSVKGVSIKLTEADAEYTKYNNSQITAANQAEAYRQGLAATGQALGELGSVLDQESAAAKALSISSAIINTYLGVTQILSQPSVLPSPFDLITKIANVATVLYTGFEAVKNIKKTPSKGGGGASTGSRSSTPRGATSTVPTTPRDIGLAPETVASEQTVRAYVVGGDVTSTQEANAKLNAKRTLG